MKAIDYFKHIWLAVRNKRELDAPLFSAYMNKEDNLETLDFMREIVENKIEELNGPRTIIKGFQTQAQREANEE